MRKPVVIRVELTREDGLVACLIMGGGLILGGAWDCSSDAEAVSEAVQDFRRRRLGCACWARHATPEECKRTRRAEKNRPWLEGVVYWRQVGEHDQVFVYPMTFGKARLGFGELDSPSIERGFCYASSKRALEAARVWDGIGDPLDGWRTKHQHECEALRVGSLAVYSILRDWIRGQVMAIETGILTFEGAFLGQIMLASGQTVLGHMKAHQMLPSDGGGRERA